MSELKIRVLGDSVLREKAKKIKNFGPDLQQLIDDMVETMHAASGIGLAAPQVGHSLRLFVAYLEAEPPTEDDDESDAEAEAPAGAKAPALSPHLDKLHVLINPELVRTSDNIVSGTEGCLSIPGYTGDVMRPDRVTVRYLNRQGHKQRIKLDGWLARVFQHEIDHLDGVLFIDKAHKMYDIESDEAEVTAD